MTELMTAPKTVSNKLNIENIRKDFPVLQQKVHGKSLIYFDNAATTQKPKAVIEAINNFYQTDNSNIHRSVHLLAARATYAFEKAREEVKKFIKAEKIEEIIF